MTVCTEYFLFQFLKDFYEISGLTFLPVPFTSPRLSYAPQAGFPLHSNKANLRVKPSAEILGVLRVLNIPAVSETSAA